MTKDQCSNVHLITASNNDFISTPGDSAAVVLCARVRRNATSVLSLDNLPTVGCRTPTEEDCLDSEFHPDPDTCPEGYFRCTPDGQGGWMIEVTLVVSLSRDTCAEAGTRRSTSVRPAPRSTPSCSSATGRGTGWTACATRPPIHPPSSPPSPPSHPPPPLRAPGGWSATTAPGPSTDQATASLMWTTSTPSPAPTSTTGGYLDIIRLPPAWSPCAGLPT